MGHLISYCILTEGVNILTIKLDGIINNPGNIDSIIVLDIVMLSICRKDIGHANELHGFLGETPFQFPLWHAKELIISCIGGKDEFLILFYGLYRLPCIFYGDP